MRERLFVKYRNTSKEAVADRLDLRRQAIIVAAMIFVVVVVVDLVLDKGCEFFGSDATTTTTTSSIATVAAKDDIVVLTNNTTIILVVVIRKKSGDQHGRDVLGIFVWDSRRVSLAQQIRVLLPPILCDRCIFVLVESSSGGTIPITTQSMLMSRHVTSRHVTSICVLWLFLYPWG